MEKEKVLIIEILVKRNGGIITPQELSELGRKVEEVIEQWNWNSGFAISGRLPVWAFAFLTHLLHPARWSGCFEPRNNSIIVVQSHVPNVNVGDMIPVDDDSMEKIVIEF